MSYILNACKSSEDKRDWIYQNKNKNNLPSSIDYRNQLQPVRNQGSQGTCYAQSAACMKELQEKSDFGLNEHLSPQFFYNNRDYWNNGQQDGDDLNEDYGMTGRDVMRILKNIGICKESEYPYGTIEKIEDIPAHLKVRSLDHKIKNYARIDSLNDLKSSLVQNGACLIAFPVYNYTDQMWIQNNDEKMNGGHAMAVVGYNDKKKHFIIRNSWGKYWGDEGYCYYKYKDWNSHWECWTTIDMDTAMLSESESESYDIHSNEENSEKHPEPELKQCDKLKEGYYKVITQGINHGLTLCAYDDYLMFNNRYDLFYWNNEFYSSDDICIFTFKYNDDDTMYSISKDNISLTIELIQERPDNFDDKINNSCWKWFKNKIFKKKN